MKDFYCNKCKEYVTLEKGKCPNCKTVLEEVADSNLSTDYNTSTSYITKSNIDKNIHFFLVCAKVIKISLIIISIIGIIISLYESSYTNNLSLYWLIPSILMIPFAFIFSNMLKWRAYMLYTNSLRK